MHILVVNDDGPPSTTASPYILALVRSLQAAGHLVSVVLPHIQRSWIGKAHFIGQLITPTYYRPSASLADIDSGTTHEFPLPASSDAEEWVLVDGTPATCTQLGLHYFFQERGAIDLVISGPNYGRNSTSLFSMSSGTLGGAMEAAAFKKRAIALSYAFFSRELDPAVLQAATELSVKIVEHLSQNWGSDVEVYSINVPLVAGVEKNKVFVTDMLENYWTGGSTFDEVDVANSNVEEHVRAEETETNTREPSKQESSEVAAEPKIDNVSAKHARHKHRHFKWAPKFTDVHRSVEQSKPGNDGWAIRQGYTSITPLRATFSAAKSHPYGEISNFNGPPADGATQLRLPGSTLITLSFYAHVAYEDPYVQPMILDAFGIVLRSGSFLLMDKPPGSRYISSATKYLQIAQYESLAHEILLTNPATHFANSYTIRKALIRKHYLWQTITSWTAKNSHSILKNHVPLTLDFELDYAEFLDDALVEAWEVKQSWEQNEAKESPDREWWILKPSMSDKGHGIRLFSSQDELQDIFDQWEDDSESDDGDTAADANSNTGHSEGSANFEVAEENAGIMTSQLRHFIMQPYIAPLLLHDLGNQKFHIRTYVLAVGALKVYVYEDMLALFSAHPYTLPGSSDPNENLAIHLTNTALQNISNQSTDQTPQQLVYPLASLPSQSTSDANPTSTSSSQPWTPTTALKEILPLTAALFSAAAAQPTSFQPLPNCFEVFGIDWLVDSHGKTWLLEVNSFPDFRQTGAELGDRIVGGFWKGVIAVVAEEWFPGSVRPEAEAGEAEDKQKYAIDEFPGSEYAGRGMWKVLDLDMGRR